MSKDSKKNGWVIKKRAKTNIECVCQFYIDLEWLTKKKKEYTNGFEVYQNQILFYMLSFTHCYYSIWIYETFEFLIEWHDHRIDSGFQFQFFLSIVLIYQQYYTSIQRNSTRNFFDEKKKQLHIFKSDLQYENYHDSLYCIHTGVSYEWVHKPIVLIYVI